MLYRSFCLGLIAAVSGVLAGCIEEQISTEVIEGERIDDEDSQQVVDELSCAAIELALAADISVSANTAPNLYEPISFAEWCASNIVSDDFEAFVGNANAWQADETDPQITATSFSGRATRPEPARGAQLDLYVLEPQGTIPFVRKIHFSDWEGPNGRCALEMRVYQQDIGETGKKPLLYFHGGGWKHRSTTMTAAEVITRYLVDDHVVFMPAYPLHQAKDGPIECRQADFEAILETSQAAFDWVVKNKDVFGATGSAMIDVMGHSAGGQLAAFIATQNRERIAKLVSFYGPVEFADFVDGARPGGRYEDTFEGSRKLLASILAVDDLANLEQPYAPIVIDNSLSEIIAREGAGAAPPFFMIQGNADTTVPVEQALLACNALGGRVDDSGGLYACGNDSHVVVLESAGHNLDRRCAGGEWPQGEEEDDVEYLMESVCPKEEGDEEAVRDAVRTAFEWLGE